MRSRPPSMTCCLRSLGLLLLALAAGCTAAPDPIVVHQDHISITNQTPDAWSDVEVMVNGYYLARVPVLRRGGRADAPLRRFVNGYGRYFDPREERVRDVKVTAKGPRGEGIVISWRLPTATSQ